MSKYFIFFIIFFILLGKTDLYSQRIIQNQKFTDIPIFNNKAVLIKEITINNTINIDEDYHRLRNWIKDNYTTDLINSSIIYYRKEQSVEIKSKVDLLLPILNSKNISEKALMTYHLYVFLENRKCIVQISDIDYALKNTIPTLKEKIKAEDFVTDNALKINDQYKKERIETQKGTLHFFNELTKSLEIALNK